MSSLQHDIRSVRDLIAAPPTQPVLVPICGGVAFVECDVDPAKGMAIELGGEWTARVRSGEEALACLGRMAERERMMKDGDDWEREAMERFGSGKEDVGQSFGTKAKKKTEEKKSEKKGSSKGADAGQFEFFEEYDEEELRKQAIRGKLTEAPAWFKM